MRVVDIIRKKRDGDAHTEEEINFLIQNYVHGAVPDYQMSAWLMAVVWRGLTDGETLALTSAMVASGQVLDLGDVPGFPIDKHSTGGVGDKTTLAVVPILASAGVPVAKMSGRGLGHTGGTLDKLESIPGTRTELNIAQIIAQVREIGACICAQTQELVPADQLLYALRDSTGTVDSLPLIAASIMSKKIAGGARAVVLDVKVGGGAFMKTVADARMLADLMVRLGDAHGIKVVAVLSDMETPLGFNVGNRVEVSEVVALLKNNPGTDARLKRLVVYFAGIGLYLARRADSVANGEALALRQLANGAAFEKLCEIVRAQGGDVNSLQHAGKAPVARVKWNVVAPANGVITGIDAQAIGRAAMRLGAGRAAKGDSVEPTAGVVLRETIGASVASGDTLATLYTNTEVTARLTESLVQEAFRFSDRSGAATPLIYETIGLPAIPETYARP